MIEKKVTVQNKLGLHARPAALLVQTAARFDADIRVSKDEIEVNAKSVMGLLMLAAENGSQLGIAVDGRDESAAMQAIEQLFQNKFDEE